MYYKLKDGEDLFIWDDDFEKMYQIINDIAVLLKSSLMNLSKFRPHLIVLETMNRTPDELKSEN